MESFISNARQDDWDDATFSSHKGIDWDNATVDWDDATVDLDNAT